MALLNKEILQDLGIEIDERDITLLEEHFDTTLRQRVIDEVVDELDDEQAEQLAIMQAQEDETLLEWIKQNVPDFNTIVTDEVNILLGEIADNATAFSTDPVDQPL